MDADLPPIRIDASARKAWLGDRPLTLRRLEYDVLALLVANVGQVVTRDDFMRLVWETKHITISATKTLDMHISGLRRKLADDPAKPHYITTVRGVGFRLEAGTAESVAPATGPDTSVVRVVLVKRGDVLVFGNVGLLDERVKATASTLSHQLGLNGVALFAGDIDMTALPGGAL